MLRLQTKVGSSLEFTDSKIKEVENLISQNKDVEQYFTHAGGNDVNNGMIFMTLKPLKERTISSCEAIVLPVNADSLRFVKYRGNILEMNCDEYCNWSNNITLFLNCETLCVMES
jgi:multidrug efflux pump subunit AcrB